jgi:predicted metal-dependent hydrolase
LKRLFIGSQEQGSVNSVTLSKATQRAKKTQQKSSADRKKVPRQQQLKPFLQIDFKTSGFLIDSGPKTRVQKSEASDIIQNQYKNFKQCQAMNKLGYIAQQYRRRSGIPTNQVYLQSYQSQRSMSRSI